MFWIRRNFIRAFSGIHQRPNSIRWRTNPLQEILSNPSATIEWECLSKELIASERNANLSNVDGIIIGMCSKEKRLDIAKSYADYIQSKSLQLSDASIGKLLRLYYNHHQHESAVDQTISDHDEAQVAKLCNYIIAKHKIIESSLAENLIHGLCLTKDWMKSLDILSHIRIVLTPNATTYSCIISKALDEDDLGVAWSLLSQMTSEQLAPRTQIYLKYFKKFKDNFVETEKMLRLIGENNLMLPEGIIEDLQGLFNKPDCQVVTIKRNGQCRSCSNKLPNNQLNEAEFAELSKTFLDDVMIRRDVFLKTNPDELKKFKDFVEKTAPYDCVIDGLNVAFSHGPQQSPQMFAKNVRLSSLLNL